MAWDTEKTQRLLLAAATQEFSEYGLAGGRIDRIADRAGVNKERIYSYFGGKDALFDAALAKELGDVASDVPIEGHGPDAVGDYAARLFDRIVARPELGRLMAWEGLTRGADVTDFMPRDSHCRDKVTSLLEVLPGISRESARQLLLTIITLTDGWAAFPQLGLMYAGGDAQKDARREAIRTLAILAARELAG